MGKAFVTATDGKRGYKVLSRPKGGLSDDIEILSSSASADSPGDEFIFGAHGGYVGNADGWHRPDVLLGHVWTESEEFF